MGGNASESCSGASGSICRVGEGRMSAGANLGRRLSTVVASLLIAECSSPCIPRLWATFEVRNVDRRTVASPRNPRSVLQAKPVGHYRRTGPRVRLPPDPTLRRSYVLKPSRLRHGNLVGHYRRTGPRERSPPDPTLRRSYAFESSRRRHGNLVGRGAVVTLHREREKERRPQGGDATGACLRAPPASAPSPSPPRHG